MRDYYCGFNIAALGAFATTGTVSVSKPTGLNAHVDLSSVATNYSAFSSSYKTALDAAGGGPWTVTWSSANLTYTISRATNFTLTFPNTAAGNNAADILGFARNTSYSGANTFTSVRRPFFVCRGVIDGQSEQSDEYEPDDITSVATANDGRNQYAIARYRAPILLDWVQPKESNLPPATVAGTGTAVFTRDVSSTVPWSWEDLIQYARAGEPMALRSSSTTTATVFKLRQDGASWKPIRVTPDLQALWDIPFRALLMGRIA